jgi:hypothetical protein
VKASKARESSLTSGSFPAGEPASRPAIEAARLAKCPAMTTQSAKTLPDVAAEATELR